MQGPPPLGSATPGVRHPQGPPPQGPHPSGPTIQRRFETWSSFAVPKIVSVVMLKVGAFQALNSSR